MVSEAFSQIRKVVFHFPESDHPDVQAPCTLLVLWGFFGAPSDGMRFAVRCFLLNLRKRRSALVYRGAFLCLRVLCCRRYQWRQR